MKVLFALLLMMAPAAALAKPLVVKMDEAVAFRIARGEAVAVRKVPRDSRPAKGEVLVSVRAMLGTTLTAINATGRGWTFKAELLSGGKASPARSCTLPKSSDPIFEQWPGKPADAVRLSRFKPADGGNC